MYDLRINFLQRLGFAPKPKKNKLLFTGKLVAGLSLVIFISLAFFSYRLIASKNGPETSFGKNLAEEIKIIFDLKHLILGDEKLLLGEPQDRINILLLGVGGTGHDGPNLTDTIILASLKPSVPKIGLVSVPRDLSAPIPGYGWRKINDANALGEAKNRGQGANLAKDTVSQVFNLPIHYYIRVDFAGFKKIVDDLGGIDVYIERAFADSAYPAGPNLYQTVSFRSGWQKMDGDTALKFVRSRHGNNGEGSDFARSQRQQKILEAVKDKIFSFSFLLNPMKISSVMDDLGEHIKTDLEPWQIIKLAKIAKEVQRQNINNKVLDNGPDGPLYASTETGVFLLLPKAGNFSELEAIASDILMPSDQLKKNSVTNKDNRALIEIQNGTKVNGLAANLAKEITGSTHFNVIRLGNAERQDYNETVIYDLTNGQKRDQLEELKKLLGEKITPANIFALPANSSLMESLKFNRGVDFVIILGQNVATAGL